MLQASRRPVSRQSGAAAARNCIPADSSSIECCMLASISQCCCPTCCTCSSRAEAVVILAESCLCMQHRRLSQLGSAEDPRDVCLNFCWQRSHQRQSYQQQQTLKACPHDSKKHVHAKSKRSTDKSSTKSNDTPLLTLAEGSAWLLAIGARCSTLP